MADAARTSDKSDPLAYIELVPACIAGVAMLFGVSLYAIVMKTPAGTIPLLDLPDAVTYGLAAGIFAIAIVVFVVYSLVSFRQRKPHIPTAIVYGLCFVAFYVVLIGGVQHDTNTQSTLDNMSTPDKEK